jgi:hypothetical protein
MQFTTTLLALAALGTSVLAGPHNHHHFHAKRNPDTLNEALTEHVDTPKPAPAPPAPSGSSSPPPVSKQSTPSSDSIDVAGKLKAIGCQPAANSKTNNGGIWIGSDGEYTNEFTNKASESIVVVIWGADGSWVNTKPPQVAIPLAPGASATVSFADGVSGAWAGIYGDTTMVNGQISNTWGEFTFKKPYTTYDVSREVNMSGKGMSISGPSCVSDMDRCVFKCDSGNTCMTGYSLVNCATGSQKGAQYGTYGGAASGGCLLEGNSLTTTFS